MRFSFLILFPVCCWRIFRRKFVITINSTSKKNDADIRVGRNGTEVIAMVEREKWWRLRIKLRMINNTSLVDSWFLENKSGENIFPEHGFRGNADNGEEVGNTPTKKQMPIVRFTAIIQNQSPADLKEWMCGLWIFKMWACFVHFITTMTYVMEACGGK